MGRKIRIIASFPCSLQAWLRAHMATLLTAWFLLGACGAFAVEPTKRLELSRPVRPWEFISVLGTRAAILGHEQGTVEAWVYPLKILNNFHLRFHIEGAIIPAETLARTVIVRPESTTIVYASDAFSVREVLFVPTHETGAIIALEMETHSPLQVEAVFHPDFQLEWPGHLSDSVAAWDASLHAFHFADDGGKFEALVGSPSAIVTSEEYATNYFSSNEDSFLLAPAKIGKQVQLIAFAASFSGQVDLNRTYTHLLDDYPSLSRDSARYYSEYLARTVNVHLPDDQLESSYDWARVSMLQGVVRNPFLGEGLVAGFDTAQSDYRPGFAWFFGRDAEWTSFALDATGDFFHVRSALEFLSKYQRADGKIPHEISQSAGLMDWFKIPFAYASADATPLFIIAADDYVSSSGDVEFVREKWNSLWKAYEFLRSTFDAQGFAQNSGVGHGWIEGGPLYPVQSELYQASLGIEASRSMSHLAHLVGKEEISGASAKTGDDGPGLLDKAFWSPDKKIYAYALDSGGNRLDVASVLSTVPMWSHLLDDPHVEQMIDELARPDHQTDWGMRIISSSNSKYDPGGYHFGSVWPLFTGWASVGEYSYHRPLPAYANLRANAQLALDGSLGHVAEVLSGDFYQTLSTGSPHQVWSAAMVVSPLLRGMLGVKADAVACHLTLAPHIPANWNTFSIDNLAIGEDKIGISYQRTSDRIRLQVHSAGVPKQCTLEFSPAVSLRARVKETRLNGKKTPFHLETTLTDQHIHVEIPLLNDESEVVIGVENDFELGVTSMLPELGGTSRGLRIISESWSASRDTLTLLVAGVPGASYEIFANDSRQIASIDGARFEKTNGPARVQVQLPSSSGGDEQATIVFHLAKR